MLLYVYETLVLLLNYIYSNSVDLLQIYMILNICFLNAEILLPDWIFSTVELKNELLKHNFSHKDAIRNG